MTEFLILRVLLYVIHVYGLENLALDKPTWEQNPWPDLNQGYGTANAVDGRYDNRVATGKQCTISADEKYTAEWRVDLGKLVSISYIIIFYRTDNYKYPSVFNSRMAGFSLYVSNTTSKGDGLLCFDDMKASLRPPLEDQNITCSVLGRYVIYYNERSSTVTYPVNKFSKFAYNELCELEVYGCNGTYGDDCFYPCPLNCLDKQCDTVTGQCYECVPGYRGQDCGKECESGKYGLNCQNNCSNCEQGTQCHNVNGLCLQGCDPGYIGPFCKTSCNETFYGINCSQKCSTKCANQTCHHIDGTCAKTKTPVKNSAGVRQVYIIGGIVGVVVVLSLIAGVLIVYKRTTTKKGCPDANFDNTEAVTHRATPNMTLNFSNIYQNCEIDDTSTGRGFDKTADDANEVDIDEKVHNENPYGDLYMNEKSIPYIAVRDLGHDINENSKNENDGFKKEYATLLYGERFPCNVGKRPENIPKNRFKTTFPYDHSRVVLVNTNTDYINANYIDDLNEKKQYIAAQGPNPNTVSDFWCMVWQENVDQIIMLTNLKEGRKIKCAQYWPDLNATMTCDNVALTAIEEQHYAYYVVRKIKLAHNKLKQYKTITQYQYTAWPDHGTPYPLSLLLFRYYVTRAKSDKENGPTLVHCSAGIGRTGTYIAIDVLFEAGKMDKKINIAEYVKKMRQNRMNMVQTYEQYKTIFLTLHEMFKAPAVALNPTEFLNDLQTKKEHALGNEFQKLLSVRPHYKDSDYKMASPFQGVLSSIRPLDKYIIYLTSNVPRRGNYINAIAAPSLTKENAFIITHYPAPEDAVDFLRLITDHDCELVVSMEPLHEVESTSQWLPTSTKLKIVCPFTLHFQQDQASEIRSCKIDIGQNEKGNETWSVNITEPSSDLIVDNPQMVSQILNFVSFTQNIKTSNPIIVVSRDGAALCGVFCAIYNLIQQLTMDEEIDVFSVVRLLQTRRPELCSSLEEYEIIHNALKNFIQSEIGENVYYNQ